MSAAPMKHRVEIDTVDGRYYGLRFECPGCGLDHVVMTDWTPPNIERAEIPGRPRWEFNGNLAMPTFSPSILVQWDTRVVDDPTAPIIWEDVPGMPGAKRDARPGHRVHHVCHSFVREGRIQFLSDCTHALAGKTVDLPEIEDAAP